MFLSQLQNNIPLTRDGYTSSWEQQQRKQQNKSTKKQCIFVSWWQIQKRFWDYKQINIKMDENWLTGIRMVLEETGPNGTGDILNHLRIFQELTAKGWLSNEKRQSIFSGENMQHIPLFCEQLFSFIKQDQEKFNSIKDIVNLKLKAMSFLGLIVNTVGSFQFSAQLAFKIIMSVDIPRKVKNYAYRNTANFIQEHSQELENLFLKVADFVTKAIQIFNNDASLPYQHINLQLDVSSIAQPFTFECGIPDNTESVLESVLMILEIYLESNNISEKEIQLVSKIMERIAKMIFTDGVLVENIALVKYLLMMFQEIEIKACRGVHIWKMKGQVKGWGGAFVRLCKNEDLYMQMLRIISFQCQQSSYLEEKMVHVHCILDVAGEDVATCEKILGVKLVAASVFAGYLDLLKEFGQVQPTTLAVIEEIKWSIFYSLRSAVDGDKLSNMVLLESTTNLFLILRVIVERWINAFSQIERLQLLKEVVFPMLNSYMPELEKCYRQEEVEAVLTDLDLPLSWVKIQTFFPAILNFIQYLCQNYEECYIFVLRGMLNTLTGSNNPEGFDMPYISQQVSIYMVTIYLLNEQRLENRQFNNFLKQYVKIDTLKYLEKEDQFGLVLFLQMLAVGLSCRYKYVLVRINGFKEIVYYIFEMKKNAGIIKLTSEVIFDLPREIMSKGVAEREYRWIQTMIGSQQSWNLLQKLVVRGYAIPTDIMLKIIDFSQKEIKQRSKQIQSNQLKDAQNVYNFFHLLRTVVQKDKRYFRDHVEVQSRIWMILGMDKQILNLQIDDLMLGMANALVKNMEEIPGYFCHFIKAFKYVFTDIQYQNCQGFAFMKRVLIIGMKNWDIVPQKILYYLNEIFSLYTNYPDTEIMQQHQYFNLSSSLLTILDVLQQEQARENISMQYKEDMMDSCQQSFNQFQEYPLIQGRMINLMLTIKLEQGKVIEPQLMTDILTCALKKGFWTYDSCLLLHLLVQMIDFIPEGEQCNLLYILIYVLRWEKERMTNKYIQKYQLTKQLNKILVYSNFELKKGKSPFFFALPLTVAMALQDDQRYNNAKNQLSQKDRKQLDELTSQEYILGLEMNNMEVKDEVTNLSRKDEESEEVSDSDDQDYRGKKRRMRRRNCTEKGALIKILRK